jgi:polysaccharide pyruvyl transferase WcaK-like protein
MQGYPRVGVWGTFDVANYGDLLFPRIFEFEMQRRVPDAEVRSFAPLGHLHPVSLDGGFLAESLTPWDQARVRTLADELDLVVIGGGEIIHTHDELYAHWYGGRDEGVRPSELFIEALGAEHETRCPVVWHSVGIPFDFDEAEATRVRTAVNRRPYTAVRDELSLERLRAAGVTAQVNVVPDSALLLNRLFPREVLERRLRFLRAIDAYPADAPPLVIQGSAALLSAVEPIAREITAAVNVDDQPIPVVLLETGPCHDDGAFASALAARLPTRVYRVGDGATIEDIVAAIVHARAVASVSLHAAITAFQYGVPNAILNLVTYSKLAGFASLAGYGELHLTTPERIESTLSRILGGATPGTTPAELVARVDAHFDRLAELAIGSAAARAGAGVAGNALRLSSPHRLEGRYQVLLRAHEKRGARLVEERLRFAALIERLEDGELRKADLAALDQARRERELLREELAQLAVSLDHAERERETRGAELARVDAELAQVNEELARAHAEQARLSAELGRLQATKTFRYTRLARRLYARLRAGTQL